MEKLILEYSYGAETCGGNKTIAFEYESKEDFLFDVLELIKNWKKSDHLDVSLVKQIEILEEKFYPWEIENFEYDLYTLDEWFKKFKVEAFKDL